MEQLLKLRSLMSTEHGITEWKEFSDALKLEQTMVLRRIIRREYKNGKHMQHLKEIEDKQLLKSEKDPFWWITINPRSTVSMKEIIYKIESFCKRKIVSNYIYVYEQRGTCERSCGDGKHIHLLIKKTKTTMPTVFKRDLKNSFKNMTDVKNENIFNVHACPQKYLKDKWNYMLGNKTGDKKDIKIKWDEVFRKQNKLKKIYYNALEPFGLEDVSQKLE